LLVLQALSAVLIALAWSLIDSPSQGVAFMIGALAVALGQFLQSVVAFTGGVRGPAPWFGRLLLGVLLKWVLVFSIMLAGMKWIAPAPLAALAGLAFSLLVIQLFNYFDAKVKRGS
jgi:hypothetical protein